MATKLSPEFQVVILAGGSGSRVYPLAEGMAKAMLPIGNKPMVAYQLGAIAAAGFPEAIVITSPEASHALKHYINDIYQGPVKVDLVVLSEESTGTADALRAVAPKLRSDFFVISSDLVSDLPLHSLADCHRQNDATLTAFFRDPRAPDDLDDSNDSAAPAGSQSQSQSSSSKSGGKSGKKQPAKGTARGPGGGKPGAVKISGGGAGAEGTLNDQFQQLPDYVGVDPESNRLLVLCAAADLEDGILPVRKKLLARCPDLVIDAGLFDAHCYLFARSVIDVLLTKPKFSSVKGELVPYLVKTQFRPVGRRPIPAGSSNATNTGTATPAYTGGSSAVASPYQAASPALQPSSPTSPIHGDRVPVSPITASAGPSTTTSTPDPIPGTLARSGGTAANATPGSVSTLGTLDASVMSRLAERLGDNFDTLALTMSNSGRGAVSQDSHRCYAVIDKSAYMIRANTVSNYIQANKDMLAETRPAWMLPEEPKDGKGRFMDASVVLGNRTMVGADSVVGLGVTWGDMGSAKRSIVGPHCTVGSQVKLANCIVMDHVTIEDEVTLQNCVIGSHAHIGSKTSLNNCQVAAKVDIPSGTEAKNDQIVREG